MFVMLAVVNENSQRAEWGLNMCMAAKEIKFWSEDAAHMSCFSG